ncbi:hypothetical protein EVAR_72794_1 [Eumeta japonica]|uniref:Uncharacterized protein n=1 Tax=Eumeta variegata TaxID=151549 RepID=A0A4C1TFA0_EUMVA|nr:hypothetical protein EVAR_72794_1 [Eumeta japonica]
MNSANQWQQQQHQQNPPITNNHSGAVSLKNSSNASILNLLNSAPAAMTNTPVASGTFTTSTGQAQQQGQQQNVTLVQHASNSQHQQQQQSQSTSVVAAEAINQSQQQQNHHHQQQLHLHQQNSQTQQHQLDQQPQTTVRVSMSALASQLASPPAIMTNSTSFGGYTLSTVSGTGSTGGSIKILNNGIQQQRVWQMLFEDSMNSTSQGPPNAIVVGSSSFPGSDSNASNASGFAVPQATSNSVVSSNNSTTLNALLANATTPSPSGSEHSQSSQNQSQSLLERLNSGAVNTGTTLSNMSPQQQHSNTQAQYITKTLAQSPATSSIHSPMSSPHPQPSPSPHLPPPQHQQPAQQQQSQTQTATLNLQGINFSTLQGAMANFPGLQNVQVQIPGFNQPISLQLAAHLVGTGAKLNSTTLRTTGIGSSSTVVTTTSATTVGGGSIIVQQQHGTQQQQQQQQQQKTRHNKPQLLLVAPEM